MGRKKREFNRLRLDSGQHRRIMLVSALLGALALGDIGGHFPDSDAKYKGVSSMLLLREVAALLAAQGAAESNPPPA